MTETIEGVGMDPIEAAAKRREYFTVVETESPAEWTMAFRADDAGSTLIRTVSLAEMESMHFELTCAIQSARMEIEERAKYGG